jgi:hypothetical protein
MGQVPGMEGFKDSEAGRELKVGKVKSRIKNEHSTSAIQTGSTVLIEVWGYQALHCSDSEGRTPTSRGSGRHVLTLTSPLYR